MKSLLKCLLESVLHCINTTGTWYFIIIKKTRNTSHKVSLYSLPLYKDLHLLSLQQNDIRTRLECLSDGQQWNFFFSISLSHNRELWDMMSKDESLAWLLRCMGDCRERLWEALKWRWGFFVKDKEEASTSPHSHLLMFGWFHIWEGG